MSQEPDFRTIIAASELEASARAAAEDAENEKHQKTKRIAQAGVMAVIDTVVLPLLVAAQKQIAEQGITADIGNGHDCYGSLRRSLRLSRPRRGNYPTLVFTAEINSSAPYLGQHVETSDSPGLPLPARIQDTSTENITQIIAEFIRQFISTP